MDVTHDGTLASGRGTLEEACQTIQDLEGAAAGFTTYADQETAWKLASRAAQATALPLMVSLGVGSRDQNQMQPTAENPYFNADTMIPAAELLQETGVQFLRAVGDATPSYSSALVAAIAGMDVVQTEQKQKQAQKKTQQDLAAFIAEARAKVSKAIQSPEHPMTMGDSAEGAGSSDAIEGAKNPEREKGSADKGLSASTQDIKDLTE